MTHLICKMYAHKVQKVIIIFYLQTISKMTHLIYRTIYVCYTSNAMLLFFYAFNTIISVN